MFSDNVTNAWWFISLYLFLLIALTFITFGKSNLMRLLHIISILSIQTESKNARQKMARHSTI